MEFPKDQRSAPLPVRPVDRDGEVIAYLFDRNQEIPTLLGFIAGVVSGEDAEKIVAFWKASCIPNAGCT